MSVTVAVSTNAAYGQIRRFKRLPGYPGEFSQLENELVQALMDVAESEQHATEIVTKLLRGWRNPALGPAQRAKEAHFCPQVVDVVECAKFGDEPTAGAAQPDEFKGTDRNPLDALHESGWFYESMCDHLIDGWTARAQNTACRSHKMAQTIAKELQRRYESLGEIAWRKERNKANQVCTCKREEGAR